VGSTLEGGGLFKENATIFHYSADKPQARAKDSVRVAFHKTTESKISPNESILLARIRSIPVLSRDGANHMHATNVQPFSVLDALTIIASCTGSCEVIELVTALRAIATDELWLPVGPRAEKMAKRIGRQLRNSEWVECSRTAMQNAETNYLVPHFLQWCLSCVPTNAPHPFADQTWLPRARILYSHDPGLRMLAESIVNQFQPFSDCEFTVPAPEPPASSIAPIAPTTSAPIATGPTPLASSPQAIRARLIAQLLVAVKAKRFIDQFVRHQNAQKAGAAPQSVVSNNHEHQRVAVAPPMQYAPVPPPGQQPIPTTERSTHECAPIRFTNHDEIRQLTSLLISAFSPSVVHSHLHNANAPNSHLEMQPHAHSLSPP